jgi:hypothetical protein
LQRDIKINSFYRKADYKWFEHFTKLLVEICLFRNWKLGKYGTSRCLLFPVKKVSLFLRNWNASWMPFQTFLWRQEVVRCAKSPSTEKNNYYEIKRRKNGTDQHDEDQQQTKKGQTIGHLKCTITAQTRKPSYYD